MTAQEEEGQRVVLLGRDGDRGQRSDFEGCRGLFAPPPGTLAAPLVHDPPRRDGHQPGARLIRDARLGPLERRRQQGLLDRILAGIEAAVAPDERPEDLRRQLPKQLLRSGIRPHLTGLRREARP